MTSVLIVDDDDGLRSAVARELVDEGMHVQVAGDITTALDHLRGGSFDVLLTDLKMSAADDGIELIEKLRQTSPNTQAILMSAYATAREGKEAMRLGAVQVLCKPFSSDELREAIQQAVECGTGFRGSVHGLSLVDLLQMFHYGRRSLAVYVGGPQGGSIHVRKGEILHAQFGQLTGEAALGAMLSATTGSIQTGPAVDAPATVTRNFQSLLLDLLRQLDEGAKNDDPDIGIEEWSLDGSPDEEKVEATPFTNGHANGRRRSMGKIDDACKGAVEKVDGAVACGVVDLDTGMLLGIYNGSQYTQTLNEVVAAATMDMFRGPNVGRVEQMVRQHRGLPENGEHYFQEVHISSASNFHFMKTIKGSKAVIILVTKKSTNIGMGWAMLKSVIPTVEPLVP